MKNDWIKEFDKWFNHGTKKEPRFAYAGGAYQEVLDFIQNTIIPMAEKNTLQQVLDIVEGMEKRGEVQQIPCPDGNPGCCVIHYGSNRIVTPEIKSYNQALSDLKDRILKLGGK